MGVRSILSTILSPIASKLASWSGAYNATDPRRKLLDPNRLFPSKSDANTLLSQSIEQLRAHCRDLDRNNPTARAAIEAQVALVVGTGIQLEPDTGDPDLDVMVREEFNAWCQHAGIDGCSFYRHQSTGYREVFVAGELLWRIVIDENDTTDIPIRILPLESEWLADMTVMPTGGDLTNVAGIQLDKYGRPVNYILQHPEYGSTPEIVSADAIVHSFEKRRAVQNRGEPGMSSSIETLHQERDLVDAELAAAKATASIGLAIESEYHDQLDTTDYGDSSDPVQTLRLGAAVRMYPGEKVHAFNNPRPSQQIAPFRQMLRGDLAGATRCPQRFLDRDVSRANYSSMRADMIDSERLLGPIREWFGHDTIGRMYREVLPFISAKIGRPIPSDSYRLVPQGQPYVDPQKDIAAALDAIEGGLSTHESEIGKRGGDYRQVWTQLASEQELAEELDLNIGESPTPAPAPMPEPSDAELEEDDDDEQTEEESSEVDRLQFELLRREIADATRQPAQPPEVTVVNEQRITVDSESAEILGRAIAENSKPVENVINVEVPEQTINVEAPDVRVEAAVVPAPVVNVAAADVTVENVVPTPEVNIDNQVVVEQKPVKATPQADGSVIMTPED